MKLVTKEVNNVRNLIPIALVGIFLLVFTLPAVSAAGTTITIGDLTTPANTTAVGTLAVNSVTNFFAATITIKYDPSVVIINSVASANSQITLTPNINNGAGTATIVADGPVSGLSGNINLADITFKAVGTPGSSSNLGLTLVQMIDINGVDIPATTTDGSFNIQPTPPVPELKTLIFTSIGLIGLFGLVRLRKRKMS